MTKEPEVLEIDKPQEGAPPRGVLYENQLFNGETGDPFESEAVKNGRRFCPAIVLTQWR